VRFHFQLHLFRGEKTLYRVFTGHSGKITSRSDALFDKNGGNMSGVMFVRKTLSYVLL
jgi:hypothetical protein